ncbi:hypothetical protein [Streptomyces sp. NPDC088766]|uniref:hypothetical protein n=1 Tax=Streptomyces sp. NPDC088766 TaxID=3365893 RepID=UPI0038119FB1
MRGLPVRPAALTALCATLALGIAAPTALAADGDAAHARTRAVPSAPLAGADALLARAGSLGDLRPGLVPVTDLLDATLGSDGDRIGAGRAQRLGAAAEEALTEAAATTGTPADAGTRTGSRAADATDDALAAVRKQVDALVAAATSGDVAQIHPAATNLVAGLADLVTSLVDGLSLPDLEGLEDPLPDVSAPPATPDLPATTPEPPVTLPEPPVTLPARTPQLPPAPVPAG